MLLIYNDDLKFWSFVTKNDIASLDRVVEAEKAICLAGSWARAILHLTRLKTARGWTGLFCLTALLSLCYLLPCHFFKPLCGNGLSRASGVVLLAFLYYSSILRTAKSRFPIIIIFSFLFKIFFKFSKMYLESTSEFLLLLKTLQSQQGERLFLL